MEESREVRLTVDPEYEGLRLDQYLSLIREDMSRSRISRLIESGAVSVNDKNIVKSSFRVSEEDVVTLLIPEAEVPEILPEDIPLDILYEDNDVVVVNKPKGMVVHPSAGHMDGTLVNALLYHCKDLSGINGVLWPGIVHRIDKDTSGSVIACKNDNAHNKIAAALKDHSLKRLYRAIVKGVIKEDGTVEDGKKFAERFINNGFTEKTRKEEKDDMGRDGFFGQYESEKYNVNIIVNSVQMYRLSIDIMPVVAVN